MTVEYSIDYKPSVSQRVLYLYTPLVIFSCMAFDNFPAWFFGSVRADFAILAAWLERAASEQEDHLKPPK